MACDEVKTALIEGTELTTFQVAHVAECSVCTELSANDAELVGLLGEDIELPDLSSDDMMLELDGERGVLARLREQATPLRVGILVAGATLVAVATALFSPRPDMADYPQLNLWVHSAVLIVLTGSLANLSLWPLHKQALSRTFRWTAIGAALAIVLGLTFVPYLVGPTPGLMDGDIKRAMVCLVSGTVTGAPLLFLGWTLERGGHAGPHRATFAALAASCVGMTFLVLHCSVEALDHHLLGHFSVALVALAAYISGRSVWKKVRG